MTALASPDAMACDWQVRHGARGRGVLSKDHGQAPSDVPTMASDRSKMFQSSRTAVQTSRKHDYLAEMKACIRDAGGERLPEDTLERWIERASLRMGMPYSRVSNIWRNRARVITAAEMDHARACAKKARHQRLMRLEQELAALREELHDD